MVVVITVVVTDERTGREELVASHGINAYTDEMVTLPSVHPQQLGAVIDRDLGEWVLDG